jgi:hypothetical protein
MTVSTITLLCWIVYMSKGHVTQHGFQFASSLTGQGLGLGQQWLSPNSQLQQLNDANASASILPATRDDAQSTGNQRCESCAASRRCFHDSINSTANRQPSNNFVGYWDCLPPNCHGNINSTSCHRLNAPCSRPKAKSSAELPCDCVTKCITVTVKTRHRLHFVTQLIQSAWTYYPGLRFVVVDEYADGAPIPEQWKSVAQDGRLVTHLSTRPGVGFGRRMATLVSETPYVLISDDDFIFTEHTNLQTMLCVLQSSNVDIVGGVTDDGFPFDGLFKVYKESASNSVLYIYPGLFYETLPCFNDCWLADIVKNFFLANKSAILGAGSWDTQRAFFEHEDFFFQMRASRLRVASCANIKIHHNTADRSLAHLRAGNYPPWRKHLLQKWQLSDYMYCFDRHSYVYSSKCTSTRPFTR